MTTAITHAPLSALSIDDKANVRTTGRGADPAFIANIRVKGIIEPLIVRKNGSGYKVTNGGKRLASLQQMLKDGAAADGTKVTADYPVPVVVRDEDDIDALDTSLSANIIGAAMHPVDEYEAYAKLQSAGMLVADISKRYGLKPKQVEQALALGALAPMIREAWRADKIGEDVARCFTVEPDHKRQEQVFSRLSKSGQLNYNSWHIKNEIRGDQSTGARLMKLVGAEAYKKAGGRLAQDLFADGERDVSVISDLGILNRLAEDMLATECKRLTEKEGWGWAQVDQDNSNSRYTYDRNSKVSKDDRKKHGAFVVIDYNGTLKVETGYVKSKGRSAAEKATAAKAEARAKKSPAKISNALDRRLAQQLRKATRIALTAENYADDELGKLLAGTCAKMVDADSQYGSSTPHALDEKLPAIRDAITPSVMKEAIQKTFDAKAYFQGAPKAVRAKAMAEMECDQKPKTVADLVKVAAQFSEKTGWLPPELRTAHYDGPAAKAAAKSSKAKPRKKAA